MCKTVRFIPFFTNHFQADFDLSAVARLENTLDEGESFSLSGDPEPHGLYAKILFHLVFPADSLLIKAKRRLMINVT